MPPTKPTYQVFKVIAREDLVAYQEAERQATAERLIEIEEGLIVKDDVYLCMHELMTNPSLKKICKMIMSYLNFESLIEARKVSKTWYCYLEDDCDIFQNNEES